MKHFSLFFWTTLICGGLLNAGETLLERRFDASYKISPEKAGFASIKTMADGKPALAIEYPEVIENVQPLVTIGLKAEDFAGNRVKFTIQAMADGIAKKRVHYHGGKFLLMLKDAEGKTTWPGADSVDGSFEWRELSFVHAFPPDARLIVANLGLQGVTGNIYYRDLKAETVEPSSAAE